MLTPSPNGARWPEPQPLANPGRFRPQAKSIQVRAADPVDLHDGVSELSSRVADRPDCHRDRDEQANDPGELAGCVEALLEEEDGNCDDQQSRGGTGGSMRKGPARRGGRCSSSSGSSRRRRLSSRSSITSLGTSWTAAGWHQMAELALG